MQTRTKILIYLAVWKRPGITELCFAGIERLRRHPDFDIEVLAVISEHEMIPLCEKYEVNWVMYKNDPLGEKKNFGLQKAKDFGFDYLMEIGSDDLILDELLDQYKNFEGEFYGICDIAYLDTETGLCRRHVGASTYGAGRMISRATLEKAGWKLWKDRLNRSLDNNSVFALVKQGIKYKQVAPLDFPCVIDVKSQENIWKFNHLLGFEFDFEIIKPKLSEKETNLLKCLVA